jgi:choice-of-anchor B domain-containing protein
MLTSNGKQSGVDTFSIVDVTNKSSTLRLSSKTYPNAGYTHQGWLTEDQRYFFMDDELDETGGLTGGKTRTHLWDVSDLNNPVYRGFFDQASTAIDHNLYVKDGFVFETNYTTGLHMFKIGNLEGPSSQWLTEVAFFDTYLPNNGATFNGAWNNYPYFPSGNIPISDINGGLFVVRPLVNGWAGFVGTDVPEPAAGVLLSGIALACLGRRSRK